MLARHCQRDHSSHLISDGIVLCFGSAFCWGPCLSIHCKGSSDNSTQCPASWFFRKGASKLTKFIEIMNVSSLLVILNMNNYNMHTWAWWISANQYLMAQFQYIHLLKNCQNFWMFMFVWSVWIKLARWSSKGLWVQLGFTKLQPLRFPASMFHWHVRSLRYLNWWPIFSAWFLGTNSLSNSLDTAVLLSQLIKLQFSDTPPMTR